MDRHIFVKLAAAALERIENVIGDIDEDGIDVELSGDVLTVSFAEGDKYIINAHSAAGQIWMAADKQAWHFDYEPAHGQWVAHKTGDELMSIVAQRVGSRIGVTLSL